MVPFVANYTHDNYIKYNPYGFENQSKSPQELNNSVWTDRKNKLSSSKTSFFITNVPVLVNSDVFTKSFCHNNYQDVGRMDKNKSYETLIIKKDNSNVFLNTVQSIFNGIQFDDRSKDEYIEPIIKGFISARQIWSKGKSNSKHIKSGIQLENKMECIFQKVDLNYKHF
jgi:hypothetical protein